MKQILYGYLSLLALVAIAGVVAAQEVDNENTVKAAEATAHGAELGFKAIGAGIAVGLTGLGAGIGEMSIGAAAVGAMAEDPKLFGKGLLMTVIPESIVIFGLVVALIILFVL